MGNHCMLAACDGGRFNQPQLSSSQGKRLTQSDQRHNEVRGQLFLISMAASKNSWLMRIHVKEIRGDATFNTEKESLNEVTKAKEMLWTSKDALQE